MSSEDTQHEEKAAVDVQIDSPAHAEQTTRSGRSATLVFSLITVLIVLAVIALLAWFLFAGPLQHLGSPSIVTNENPPAQQTAPPNSGSAPEPGKS